jgi:hypothetical protein
MVLTELDGFAHDLFAFMSTGVHLDTTQSQPSRAPLHAVAVPQEA